MVLKAVPESCIASSTSKEKSPDSDVGALLLYSQEANLRVGSRLNRQLDKSYDEGV